MPRRTTRTTTTRGTSSTSTSSVSKGVATESTTATKTIASVKSKHSRSTTTRFPWQRSSSSSTSALRQGPDAKHDKDDNNNNKEAATADGGGPWKSMARYWSSRSRRRRRSPLTIKDVDEDDIDKADVDVASSKGTATAEAPGDVVSMISSPSSLSSFAFARKPLESSNHDIINSDSNLASQPQQQSSPAMIDFGDHHTPVNNNNNNAHLLRDMHCATPSPVPAPQHPLPPSTPPQPNRSTAVSPLSPSMILMTPTETVTKEWLLHHHVSFRSMAKKRQFQPLLEILQQAQTLFASEDELQAWLDGTSTTTTTASATLMTTPQRPRRSLSVWSQRRRNRHGTPNAHLYPPPASCTPSSGRYNGETALHWLVRYRPPAILVDVLARCLFDLHQRRLQKKQLSQQPLSPVQQQPEHHYPQQPQPSYGSRTYRDEDDDDDESQPMSHYQNEPSGNIGPDHEDDEDEVIWIPELARDEFGRTPLHIAAAMGCHVSVLYRLIFVGIIVDDDVDVGARPSDGSTPLHPPSPRRCRHNHHQPDSSGSLMESTTTRALMMRDYHGRTPLHWACTNPTGLYPVLELGGTKRGGRQESSHQWLWRNVKRSLRGMKTSATTPNQRCTPSAFACYPRVRKQHWRRGSNATQHPDVENMSRVIELLVQTCPAAVSAHDMDGTTPMDLAMQYDADAELLNVLGQVWRQQAALNTPPTTGGGVFNTSLTALASTAAVATAPWTHATATPASTSPYCPHHHLQQEQQQPAQTPYARNPFLLLSRGSYEVDEEEDPETAELTWLCLDLARFQQNTIHHPSISWEPDEEDDVSSLGWDYYHDGGGDKYDYYYGNDHDHHHDLIVEEENDDDDNDDEEEEEFYSGQGSLDWDDDDDYGYDLHGGDMEIQFVDDPVVHHHHHHPASNLAVAPPPTGAAAAALQLPLLNVMPKTSPSPARTAAAPTTTPLCSPVRIVGRWDHPPSQQQQQRSHHHPWPWPASMRHSP